MPAKDFAHVDNEDEPLPAPLTTRNLRPRYNAKTATRSSNQRKGNSRSSTRTLRSSTSLSVHTNSYNSMGSDDEQPIAGPSNSGLRYPGPQLVEEPERAAKRRRTGRAGTDTPEWTSDGDEEIDQLISDSEEIVPPESTLEPGPPLSQLETSTDGGGVVLASPTTSTAANTPVSSPSLAKILHTTNVEPQKPRSPSPIPIAPTSASTSASDKPPAAQPPPAPEAELLSEYTCPICFFPPTNATLTPCGHICCGMCLFTAIRTTMQRGAIMMAEGNGARYA